MLPPAGGTLQSPFNAWAHTYTKFTLEGNWNRMGSCMKSHLSCPPLCGLWRGRRTRWKTKHPPRSPCFRYGLFLSQHTALQNSAPTQEQIKSQHHWWHNQTAEWNQSPRGPEAFQQNGITQPDHAAGQCAHWRASIVSEQSRTQRLTGAAAGWLHTLYFSVMFLKGPRVLYLIKENWVCTNVNSNGC